MSLLLQQPPVLSSFYTRIGSGKGNPQSTISVVLSSLKQHTEPYHKDKAAKMCN